MFRDLLGFTEGEIRQFFRGYLIRSAALLNHMPLQDVTEQHIDILMDELRRHYGGYCFDMKGRSRVFQTWSVLNFLNQSSEPGFGDYWYETGVITDSMKEYFAARIGTPGKAQTKAFWECDFSASQYSPAIDTGVLLTQCGYYTILSGDGDVIEIGLPNLELKQAHARIVMDGIMPASVRREMRERLPFFTGAVKAADAAYFFNVFLTALPEARKPGTAGEVCDWLRIFLLSRGLDARSGEYGTDASAWLLCEFPDVGIIMEMMYEGSWTVQQVIKSRRSPMRIQAALLFTSLSAVLPWYSPGRSRKLSSGASRNKSLKAVFHVFTSVYRYISVILPDRTH